MLPTADCDRKASCGISGKKPAVAIDESFAIWIGNLTDADCTYEAMDLFGFGRGSFEVKEVRHELTKFVLFN